MFYIKKIQAIQYNNNLEEVKYFISPKYVIDDKCPQGMIGLFSVKGEWIGYLSATDWLVKTRRKIKIYTDNSFKEYFAEGEK